MRKFKFILVIALLSSLFLQSCNSKVDNPSMYALVTVKENFMANTWFGLTDNGEKIYPGDVSRISGYKAEDGQRAMISFTPLDEKVQGYEYNAIIYDITNITTKSIVVLSDPSLDTLGTSKAGLGETWIAGGYLNSNVVVPGNYYTQHYINLVYNELDQDGDDSDYEIGRAHV